MVVEARQSFSIFRQKTGSYIPAFYMVFCITKLVLSNYQIIIKSIHKKIIYITQASHLKEEDAWRLFAEINYNDIEEQLTWIRTLIPFSYKI